MPIRGLKGKIKKAQESGMTYERLFELAYKMHLKIFKLCNEVDGEHCIDEKKVYDELGLTEEENALFGYGYLNKVISKEELTGDYIDELITEYMKEHDMK